MHAALRQLMLLWLTLLLLGGVSVSVLRLPPVRTWLWLNTGEEEWLAQVKGLTDLLSDRMRPPLELAAEARIQHVDGSPFGVNTFLEQEVEPTKQLLAVQMAAEAGFRWLRQEFPWEDLEIHGKGDFEDRRHQPYRSAWEKYDRIVAAAETFQVELIVRLSNPPGWTRAQGEGENAVETFAPPDRVQDFADYVQAVVSRYKGRIRYYQLWNEPNIYPEWGSAPIDPESYVELLAAGATAARAVDPGVVILAGALASTINLQPAAPPPGNSLNDLLFLQRMYDAGAAPYFDIMAMQGYGLYSGPTDRRMHPRVINISRHQFVRDLMVKNGDAHKPIWIAEMNWNAAPADVEPRYGRVTLDQQARYLPLAYARLRAEWPWVGVANVWYLKRATDLWEQNRQPEAYFRLLAPDFTPQPVYTTLSAFVQRWNERP